MDINKVTLMGNVGGDPTFHQMQNGDQLCKFSVATSRKWNDKSTGDKKEDTQWHNVVVFNKYLVDVVERFIVKGTRIYLEGESRTRSYEKDGVTRYITEVLVPSMRGELIVIARGKNWDDQQSSSPSPRPLPPPGSSGSYESNESPFDDDIPF